MQPQPQVLNMVEAEAALAVVLRQIMVALVYLVLAEAAVDNREAVAARMVEHGVTMAPQPANTEVLEAQERQLAQQGRVEVMVLEMGVEGEVLELEEVLGVQAGLAALQAVVAGEDRVEVMEEVLTQEWVV